MSNPRIAPKAILREKLRMGRLGVSVVNEQGGGIFSAEFLTHKTAKCFIEWRLEELLAQGAKYVDIVDRDAQT